MTAEILLLLVILGAAMAFFTFEWVPADVTALGVLLSLVLAGVLPANRAFAGFGSDTVMMILGLLILTVALQRTGVVEIAGRIILRRTGDSADRLLVMVMLASCGLSAFISNTATTAFFLPMVVALAGRARVSTSTLLMPLAFASILSSSVTLVSTSTNMVVSGLITQYNLPPVGMFELAPVGLPIAAAGLAYMLLVGRRLMPQRSPPEGLTAQFGLGAYLSELVVLSGSPLIGKTLAESGFGRDLDLTVLRVRRGKDRRFVPRANTRLEAGDVLLVEGRQAEILKVRDTAGIDIRADIRFADPELQAEDTGLVEVVLLPRSPLIGRSLKGSAFRERYGLQVLAINRHGETILRKMSQVPLRMGDVLLVQGHRGQIAALQEDNTYRILGAVEEKRPNVRRARIAVGIFAGVLAAATFNVLALPVAVLLGALLAFVTRCITPEEAYRGVEWKTLIVIGSMLGLGAAMEHTGAAKLFAAQIVSLAGGADPAWLLAAFFALTLLLTQPMSNQAAAVVVVPVAIQAALQLGLNPRTFAMMIAVAASCSYLTPLEPSCLLVFGPGRYRFVDFVKVGAPLTVLIFALAIMLVPRIWPL